jgi:hypothetical protein
MKVSIGELRQLISEMMTNISDQYIYACITQCNKEGKST